MAYYPTKSPVIQDTAIQQQERPVDILKNILSAPSVQAQFKNALGEHKDTFVASLVELYTGDQSLQKCKQNAVVAEALRAATLRLPLNRSLGFSYIVVYNTSKKVGNQWVKEPTPTFILGYKGYIQLAMRTGQYRTINADVVYAGEVDRVDKLTGELRLGDNRLSDTIVGYFCYFELLNGFSKTLYMSVEEMAAYAKRFSPSFAYAKDVTVEALIEKANAPVDTSSKKAAGWDGNFNDMAIKTVIRRLLSKYGYLSVEMQNAMSDDIKSDIEERDGLIEENANAQELPLEDVPFDEVPAAISEISSVTTTTQKQTRHTDIFTETVQSSEKA